MRCNGDRCVALGGEIGIKVSCAVYDARPMVCREFVPGTQYCAQVRQYFNL